MSGLKEYILDINEVNNYFFNSQNVIQFFFFLTSWYMLLKHKMLHFRM